MLCPYVSNFDGFKLLFAITSLQITLKLEIVILVNKELERMWQAVVVA
jgi:hypothetical protein